MHSIFKKSMELNQKIESFLDTISDGLLLFEKMLQAYLQDDIQDFGEISKRIALLESKADTLESEIKVNLYKFLLLPDVRADLLSLIKSLDNIIDATEEISKELFIEKPVFPKAIHKDILAMTSCSIKAADALLLATRAFLNDLHMVGAHINKVKFFEHEADITEEQIMMSIFNEEWVTDLAKKLQLKAFVQKIADISDESEMIGDKLTIFTLKREI